MFRCQFSGEVSEPAEFRWEWKSDPDVVGTGKRLLQRVLVKSAEKPIKVAIQFRTVVYQNYGYDPETGHRVRKDESYGKEIVKEILIKPKYLEAVKKKYGLD